MLTFLKNNFKKIIISIGLQFVGMFFAILIEDYYRQLVRFFFKFFNGYNIQFVGKNFHFFASPFIVISFGIFVALTYLSFFYALRTDITKLAWTIVVFFAMTIIVTAFDSTRLVVECTACGDGIRKLTYNQPSYDTYFIASLSVSLIFLFWKNLMRPKIIIKTT